MYNIFMIKIKNDWDQVLEPEFKKEYFKELMEFLNEEYENHTIYPDKYDIFNGFKFTPYNKVRVVIFGQDPYHEEGQAHGLAFSVKKGVAVPPSLKNIYKELASDTDFVIPAHGYLEPWARQGVLMLNAVLTVRQGQANSHKGKGWETFTDNVIKKINEKEDPVVFILWGNNARAKKKFITNERHLVLEGVHPSPLSAYRGFFGSKVFSKTNEFLKERYGRGIDWTVEP